MNTSASSQSAAPWYVRGKAVIIGLGALAAAALAVFGLWDRIFPADEVDIATIDSVDVIGQSSLSEFVVSQTDEELQLEPVPVAADCEIETAAQAVEPTVAPPSTSTDGSRSTALPNPSLPSPPANETFPSALPNNPPSSQQYVVDPSEHVDPRNPFAGPLTPREFSQSLTVEESDCPDPPGWIVSVNLSLEGYKNVPLLLTWSLDGISVPADWEAENLAYRILASTSRDAGTAEIWVPDLQPEVYNVNVELALESDPEFVVARGEPTQIPIR